MAKPPMPLIANKSMKYGLRDIHNFEQPSPSNLMHRRNQKNTIPSLKGMAFGNSLPRDIN